MNRMTWKLLLVSGLMAATACSNDPTASTPRQGTLRLRLTTPHSNDGAMLFKLHGRSIDSVLTGNPTLQLFTRRVDDSTVAGALVGMVAGGDVMTLEVSDANPAGYTATVTEVADRNNELRASLEGYGLTVTR